ncbi:hypothetical protein RvY_05336-2 [Ramazzottius varieornatus]|uniref:inositol-polyphosphate 5-phosphatase n=1 Tax=Ramazzottius varieornatus TaxID=947166 RepID=A0A1D1UUP8_RAMVA|nr:hypothetical protein RvY_05336-2 [Ramazzottius varieornatus]
MLSDRMEDSDGLSLLLVTANVGTLFEMADVLMEIWMAEFGECVAQRQPKFIALHCQEIGGKIVDEETMVQTNAFCEKMHSQSVFSNYDRGRTFIDAEFESTGKFTALGSFYFVHKSVRHAHIWDFKRREFTEFRDYEAVALPVSSDDRCTAQRMRFPPDLHPLATGNRKGFIITRWMIDDRIFDLINIHMFHDANNFVAMESSPSSYTEARKAALQHVMDTLDRGDVTEPFFLFGDFNFRLDSHEVVKKLTENGIRQEVIGNGTGEDSSPARRKIRYVDSQDLNKLLLTVGKKTFDYYEAQDAFRTDNGKWLRTFDNELSVFPQLHEKEITFPPSYPYEEDVDRGTSLMKTRCPAWCDRVLMNSSAWNLIDRRKKEEYSLIGPSVCMGDHKPVFLYVSLTSTVNKRNIVSVTNEGDSRTSKSKVSVVRSDA